MCRSGVKESIYLPQPCTVSERRALIDTRDDEMRSLCRVLKDFRIMDPEKKKRKKKGGVGKETIARMSRPTLLRYESIGLNISVIASPFFHRCVIKSV